MIGAMTFTSCAMHAEDSSNYATENVTIDKLLGYKKNGRRHSFLDTYSEQDGSAEA